MHILYVADSGCPSTSTSRMRLPLIILNTTTTSPYARNAASGFPTRRLLRYPCPCCRGCLLRRRNIRALQGVQHCECPPRQLPLLRCLSRASAPSCKRQETALHRQHEQRTCTGFTHYCRSGFTHCHEQHTGHPSPTTDCDSHPLLRHCQQAPCRRPRVDVEVAAVMGELRSCCTHGCFKLYSSSFFCTYMAMAIYICIAL